MGDRWYRVSIFSRKPEPVTMKRETEKCYFVEEDHPMARVKVENRYLKDSRHTKLFRTWAEARDYLISRDNGMLKAAYEGLDHAKKRLEQSMSLPVEEPANG